MAIELLTTEAIEKSSYVITAVFRDEDRDLVVPDSITWTITDKNGTVINNREDEAVSVPASSVDIVLSGDDLSLLSGESSAVKAERRFTIEAVYNSDLANNLPLRDSVKFYVRNLQAVS